MYLAYILAFYLENIMVFYLAYIVTLYLAIYIASLLPFYLASILTCYLARPGGAHCDLELAVEARGCPLGEHTHWISVLCQFF